VIVFSSSFPPWDFSYCVAFLLPEESERSRRLTDGLVVEIDNLDCGGTHNIRRKTARHCRRQLRIAGTVGRTLNLSEEAGRLLAQRRKENGAGRRPERVTGPRRLPTVPSAESRPEQGGRPEQVRAVPARISRCSASSECRNCADLFRPTSQPRRASRRRTPPPQAGHVRDCRLRPSAAPDRRRGDG